MFTNLIKRWNSLREGQKIVLSVGSFLSSLVIVILISVLVSWVAYLIWFGLMMGIILIWSGIVLWKDED